jgi:hypothetical protein
VCVVTNLSAQQYAGQYRETIEKNGKIMYRGVELIWDNNRYIGTLYDDATGKTHRLLDIQQTADNRGIQFSVDGEKYTGNFVFGCTCGKNTLNLTKPGQSWVLKNQACEAL